MKKFIVFVLVAWVCSSFAPNPKLNWYSWNEGYKLAQEGGKPMLIYIQAAWCDKCKRMNDKTFNSDEVRLLIEKSYVPVKYDVDTDMKKDSGFIFDGKNVSGKEILKKLITGPQLGIPLTVLWKPGSENKVSIEGLQDPAEMKEKLGKNLE